MSTPASFVLFPLLPTELRLQIWRLSCHPRVVEVIYDQEHDRCTTAASLPPVLQACRESRSEASKLYKRSFGTVSHEPRIYFCREMDILYLPRPPFMGYDDSSRSFADVIRDTDGIVNLAIDYVPPSIKRPWETYNKYVLIQSFPKVHEVLLVTDTAASVGDGHYAGDLDLADTKAHPADMSRVLEDVKMSFYYEVGGQIGRLTKEASMEALRLPRFVLKLKVWAHQ
ncbi:hypothetical protein GGR50DRAFT_120135 [Xylaria sp. CBS 124048]|nr:hypothetical protein GGR50DRAFT_120135 [Xylaria sp. CBS 124048]